MKKLHNMFAKTRFLASSCLYFRLFDSVELVYENLPMTGFELRTSMVGRILTLMVESIVESS